MTSYWNKNRSQRMPCLNKNFCHLLWQQRAPRKRWESSLKRKQFWFSFLPNFYHQQNPDLFLWKQLFPHISVLFLLIFFPVPSIEPVYSGRLDLIIKEQQDGLTVPTDPIKVISRRKQVKEDSGSCRKTRTQFFYEKHKQT